MSGRRRLVIATAVLVVLAVGWLVLDRTVLHDRRLGKDAAVAHCLADLRDDVQRRIHSDAQFGEPTVMQTVVSEDVQGLLRHDGRAPSSVRAAWQVNGQVSLPGSVPFGSGLESHNTFLCTALVFDDNSVETFARQIFP